ncbi:hypothetical protein L0Y69_00365 [bacterium]|nr:hypothetical protein [bacterium]
MQNNHNNIFRQAILDFPKQFEFEPEVVNQGKLGKFKSAIIAGMGGSHLAADILQMGTLPLRLTIHSDYGLPPHIPEEELKESLVIASSYSGNTEETLGAFEAALARGMSLAVVPTGGKLLEKAKDTGVPYVLLPATGIQPRTALGLSLRALAKILGLENILKETKELASTLRPVEQEEKGKMLAEKLVGKVPVVYASQKNYALAYCWKIILNETAKVPAFYNVFPELNHNEMIGFDKSASNEKLLENFSFIFLKDSTNHPRIQKRMEILKDFYTQRGLEVLEVEIGGGREGESEEKNIWEKTFSSILLSDWVAYHLAELRGVEANDVLMIEEFKKTLG